ncbi:MAG: hypothetical protein ABGY11_10130 [Candidatus Thioglobus sp.]|jgi:hypothetical protein
MHTYEQCKIKIEGIKEILDRIKKHSSKENSDAIHMTESAIIMCNELLREDIRNKGTKC